MRGRGGGRKQPNPLTRSYESNGPDVKVRGTASNIAEKYQQLARDAQSSGDRVAAENYLQHAEHYLRIIAAAQAQQQAEQQERAERAEQSGRRDGGRDGGRRGDGEQHARGSAGDDAASANAPANNGSANAGPANGAAGEGESAESGGNAAEMGLPAFLRNVTKTPAGDEADASEQSKDASEDGKGEQAAEAKPATRRRRRKPAAEEAETPAEGAGGSSASGEDDAPTPASSDA